MSVSTSDWDLMLLSHLHGNQPLVWFTDIHANKKSLHIKFEKGLWGEVCACLSFRHDHTHLHHGAAPLCWDGARVGPIPGAIPVDDMDTVSDLWSLCRDHMTR